MRPGQYDKHVTVWKSPDTTPDSDGYYEALSPADWWCALRPLSPSGADGTRLMLHEAEGRYHPQITVDTRLLYGAREIFVKGVQDLNDKHHTMILFCEEVIS